MADFSTFLPSRRQLLRRAGGGFGVLALAGMLAETRTTAAPTSSASDPLAPRPGHFPATAKNVIFLFSTGGASHVDTFDCKPRLFADHNKKITVDNWQGMAGKFERYLKKPNWPFKPYGKSGIMVSDLFPHLGAVIDDVCVLNAMVGDTTGHDKATLGMHTGSFAFARPSMGSWVSYGLGTENRNLPSFVVIAPAVPYAGTQNWGSDFLPGCHQGTQVIPGQQPLPNIKPGVPQRELQEMETRVTDPAQSQAPEGAQRAIAPSKHASAPSRRPSGCSGKLPRRSISRAKPTQRTTSTASSTATPRALAGNAW